MRVTATEAKNRFGSLCAQAKREPVFEQKAGQLETVILSADGPVRRLHQPQRQRGRGHPLRGGGPERSAGCLGHAADHAAGCAR
jgi:hypothetical protein